MVGNFVASHFFLYLNIFVAIINVVAVLSKCNNQDPHPKLPTLLAYLTEVALAYATYSLIQPNPSLLAGPSGNGSMLAPMAHGNQ